MRSLSKLILLLALAAPAPALAEPEQVSHGGDVFAGGSGSLRGLDAPRDVLAGGNAITIGGRVAGDVHAAGFTVDIEAPTGGDVLAAGANVTLRAPVGEDLTAAGFTLRTAPAAEVAGNARLAGGTVTVEGPVRGALSIAAAEVILNAPVSGDVSITAESISFGPDAVVSGQFHYRTDDEHAVPERVATPDRVTWQRLERGDMLRAARDSWEQAEYPALPTTQALLGGFILTLAFFVLLGALFLAFAPRLVQRLRTEALAAPGQTLVIGVLGLSTVFGLVPVSAMTIVGLPLLPFVLLFIVVLWTLGYLLGAYVVAMRFWQAFGSGGADPTRGARLVVLAAGVTVATLLNFIPFIGWAVNFTLVLFGTGAMARLLTDRWTGRVAGPNAGADTQTG